MAVRRMRVTGLVVVLQSLACLCLAKPYFTDYYLVMMPEAPKQGAVCLDGSPPGYYMHTGSGTGEDKWMVHFQGGRECADAEECYERIIDGDGSSKDWTYNPPGNTPLNGLLSSDSTINPDFYNWNKAYLMSCGGMASADYLEEPIYYEDTPIYFRGQKLLLASLDDLMERGMSNASQVLLTGTSAGGQGVFHHIDYVREYLPQNIELHGLADAGYLLDLPTMNGEYSSRDRLQSVFTLQNLTGGIDQDCVQAHSDDEDGWRCVGPPVSWPGASWAATGWHTYPYVTTPIFVVNSYYDKSQLRYTVQVPCLLECSPSNVAKCLGDCSEEEMETIQGFKVAFLDAVQPVLDSPTDGAFITSCLEHRQAIMDQKWSQTSIEGQTMRGAFAEWYFSRVEAEKVDQAEDCKRVEECEYPNCNPTCTTRG